MFFAHTVQLIVFVSSGPAYAETTAVPPPAHVEIVEVDAQMYAHVTAVPVPTAAATATGAYSTQVSAAVPVAAAVEVRAYSSSASSDHQV